MLHARGLFAVSFCLAVSISIVCNGAQAAAGTSEVTAFGIVSQGAEENGTIWFELARIDEHFVMTASEVPDPDAVFSVLKDSANSGRSLLVRYDSDSGVIDSATSKPTFVVRALVYDGRETKGQTGALPRSADEYPRAKAESELAKGVALYSAGDTRNAKIEIERALASGLLSQSANLLALKTHGNAAHDEALGFNLPGPERDRLLVAALADYRAWENFASDDPDAASAIAATLAALGAYDEALERYRAIYDKWPDEHFWAMIRIGAIYRTEDEYAQALSTLDDLVARDGPQTGMPYHYHRARTLVELGRFGEAIAVLNEGMKSQPDYTWAYVYRSCSLAALGRLREALADQDYAVGLLSTSSTGEVPSPIGQKNSERATAVADRLRAMVNADENTKIDGLCDSYGDWGETKRARSPLLSPPVGNLAQPPG